MKRVFVNGTEIAHGAVRFELDRLLRFYRSHGIPEPEIEKSMEILEEKALEQAIGAKLLLDRALALDVPVAPDELDREVAKVVSQVGGEANYRKTLAAQGLDEARFRKEIEKGAKVNKLVEMACAGVAAPTDAEIEAHFEAHREEWTQGGKVQFSEVRERIGDLLRHEARGRAMDSFVADLRANAKIEYLDD